MAIHNHTGLHGEQLAVDYIAKAGYAIIEKNWRFAHWEIDIIASKDNTLQFIEVKTRRSKKFGQPEDSVSKKKMQNLVNAAEEYLHQQPQWKRIQFNILSISILKNKPVEYFLIEDVYL